MYEDILESYDVKEIVRKIRENSEKTIMNHNSFLGLKNSKENFRHGDIELQMEFIQYLIDKNINVEIVYAPICLTEDDKPVTIRSFAINNNKIDFSDRINKNIKTVFFYTWVKMPDLGGKKEERDLLRFAYMEDRCKVKNI